MADDIKRLNYFNGQFLREPDFSDEQKYHLQHQRDHSRLMHTPGVANGLEVPDPAAGSTAVTVSAGVAYDDLGRRLVLANNKEMEMAGFAADEPVYITISYKEDPSDPTNETGISGNTRMTESPLVEASLTAPSDPQKLLLAKVNRGGAGGKIVGTIDRTGRLQAGAKGGNLTAYSVTLASDTVASGSWAKMRLTGASQVLLESNLNVDGTFTAALITGALGTDTVGTPQLQDLSVSTTKLANGAVTAAKIANLAVGTAQIANLAVGTAQLADGSVTAAKIADLNVLTADIADLSVTSAKLANGAVTGTKLAAGAVGTGNIAAGAVGTTHLSAGAVTASAIAAGAVGTASIANLAVGTSQLADGSVTGLKIAAGAVGAGQLAAGAVTATQLADGAVTALKIAAGAVGAGQIAAGAVGAGQIAAGAVGGTQIAAGAVGATQIATGAVGATQIANGAVGVNQLANLAVNNTKLADGSVSATKLANGAVTSASLGAGQIAFNHLKLVETWNQTMTLGASGSSGVGSSVSGWGGFAIVDVTPTSASGSVSWTIEVQSGAVTPVTSWTHVVRFKNNSTTASVSFSFRIYMLQLS